jgi:hypothetical protein
MNEEMIMAFASEIPYSNISPILVKDYHFLKARTHL